MFRTEVGNININTRGSWIIYVEFAGLKIQIDVIFLLCKAWFPHRCICRICRVSRTKKIHRKDITLWKPPVQMLNTKEMTDITCRAR